VSNLPAADTPKVAIITGAGSGIGRAVALKLLANDFRVVLAGRRENALQETLNLADKNTVNGLVVPTDVTDANSVQRLFDCAAAEFGRVDVLFNNAGISAPGELLEDISVEAWQQVVNVNLTGPFFCTQAAFRQMKQQSPMGGRIINNGSVSCWAPRPNSSPYTATKHAITGLTKATSLDGRKYNIACGQIDIGNAGTDMTSRMDSGVPQADGSIASEPTIDVNHIADAVLYMASLPLDANVQFMTAMATKMPLVGRG
jgi:NAD(P)-dependent dehydrogenase (short-subunit alcohol dehydrogenase family)